MEGRWYCWNCMERAALRIIESQLIEALPRPRSHRIPLGLLLLARGSISDGDLRRALAACASRGKPRIGEWLVASGLATEIDVLAALAQQSACPILSMRQAWPIRAVPAFPASLARRFSIVPIHFCSGTGRLHLAVSAPVDHTLLYAIERMLACRTFPSLISDRVLSSWLAQMPVHSETVIAFDQVRDPAEIAHITASYALRLRSDSLQFACAAGALWACLRVGASQTHLLFEHIARASLAPSIALRSLRSASA